MFSNREKSTTGLGTRADGLKLSLPLSRAASMQLRWLMVPLPWSWL